MKTKSVITWALFVTLLLLSNVDLHLKAQSNVPYPPPPPPNKQPVFRPVPRGEGNPCPSPECDCHYERDYFDLVHLEDNHECIPCSNGEKVLLGEVFLFTGKDCDNESCISGIGKERKLVEIWGERVERVFGTLQGWPGERSSDPDCSECPECPLKEECFPERTEPCDVDNPDIEEREPTVEKTECICNERV